MALGLVDADEVRSLVPLEATHYPDPATRSRYDRMFAEFPAFYSAQRGLFARLNRGR
jgi:sugar (pentulose or hexulose) kinase